MIFVFRSYFSTVKMEIILLIEIFPSPEILKIVPEAKTSSRNTQIEKPMMLAENLAKILSRNRSRKNDYYSGQKSENNHYNNFFQFLKALL